MAINPRVLNDIWGKYLFWYQHSLWFNWVWLPIFGGMAIAPFFVQNQYSDMYEVIGKSEIFKVTGKLKKIYYRSNPYIKIKTKYSNYNAYCTISFNSVSNCINHINISDKSDYNIDMANYKGYNIIISIRDRYGKDILSSESQLSNIKSSSIQMSKRGYLRQSIFGLVAVLISASPMRYLFTIRSRRRRMKAKSDTK